MLSTGIAFHLQESLIIANKYHHETATYEHLMVSLMNDDDIKELFRVNNINIKFVSEKLQQYLKYNLRNLVNESCKNSKPDTGIQRLIQKVMVLHQLNHIQNITTVHILMEFFFEPNSYAIACLKDAGFTQEIVAKYLSIQQNNDSIKGNNILNSKNLSEIRGRMQSVSGKNNESLDSKTQSSLETYCVNLNQKAKKGVIDCLIGRENEIQRTIEILCKRKKNNALLIGEPGVGKTAIAEGLAFKIINQAVPNILQHFIIYSLDIGSLVAGAKHRGDFEERIKTVFAEINNRSDVILFIDEIHTIIGAGSTASGTLDASNLLKPALARGEIRCIGSTTFKEYHNHLEKDMALVRRFQKVIISEPNEQESINILNGLKEYYEKHHEVKYTNSALSAAVMLSERYIHDRRLPDKAIDLIDEAGARYNLMSQQKNKSDNVITEQDIKELTETITNIQNISLDASDIELLQTLESNLKSHIFGQDEAIAILCASVKLSMAGLKNKSRPTGCYMFAGNTGVGKTELAKQLAKFCNMRLIEFDMSEYTERHSVSKLLGSPPGYAGFDQGGQLTEEVDKYPYSVILFNEIEKAHTEILNLLLQIMDSGTLSDNTGKIVNFTHTIIILTTNLGADINNKTPIGFGDNHENIENQGKASLNIINNTLSPELRSRLDNIIIFNSLNDKIINMIIEKNLRELEKQLLERNVKVSLNKFVNLYIANKCLAQRNGARILDRIIDVKIKQRIADEILFGKLKQGGTVLIESDNKGNALNFRFMHHNKTENTELLEISSV